MASRATGRHPLPACRTWAYARETMHLVDEQHGAVLEIREDRREIAGAFYRRSAGDLYRNSKLVGDHVRERGLPHSRRTVERHARVVRAAPSLPRSRCAAEL